MPAEQYPENWDKIRREVYQRDQYECQTCGAQGGKAGDTELHAHHKTPVSDGGSHELSNLVTLCKSCHNNQHDHDITKDGDSEPMVPLSVGVTAGRISMIKQLQNNNQSHGFLKENIFFPLLIAYGFMFVFSLCVLVGTVIVGLIPLVPRGFGGILGCLVAIPIGVSIGLSAPKKSILGGVYSILLTVLAMLIETDQFVRDFQMNILGEYGVLGGVAFIIVGPLVLVILYTPTTTASIEYLTGGRVSELLN